ncbi:hypothetical protein LSH36_233g07007 [Paralvinella palmiformis]|uniref:Peptidase S54 rhomboid domain-containing protein n=1 Tax=Paralvinella palmiformis TaxID=53620 RepID=A0AAD9JMB6_9ANNE|nr:hypothetical protein LSH36_233g07007 [Paralvinella palmiformis]
MLRNIDPSYLIYLYTLLCNSPITLVLMSTGAIAFMVFVNVRDHHIQHCCLIMVFIGVFKACHYYDYKWLVVNSIFYIDQRHFIFDMISLVWKGWILREKVGPFYFVFMTLAFAVVTNPLYVVVQLFSKERALFSGFTSYETHDPSEYVAGFSGVLFALNVVMTNSASGIAVQHRYIMYCWFELLLIQMCVPSTSLIIPTIRHNRPVDNEILLQYGDWPEDHVIQTLPYVRDYSAEFRRYTGGLSEDVQMEIVLPRSRVII